MAPLTDPDRLQSYKDALSNWEVKDYVQFHLHETAYKFVRRELDGVSLDGIKRRMWEYVLGEGGEIDEQRENRREWSGEYEFHHDLRLTIQDKKVYIETRLHFRVPFVPDESWIDVVNVHFP